MTRKIIGLAGLALLTAVSVAVAQTPEVAEVPAEAPVEAAVEAAVETAAEPVEVVEEALEPVVEEPVAEEPVVEEPVVEEPVAVVPPVEEAPSVDTVIAASPVVSAGPVCCPIQIVGSHATLGAKHMYRCSGPPVETMACVDNPADCTCTLYQIPLCIPCCCVGEPQVCNARVGLLGRGHVDLVWPCGFTAKVVFLVHGGAKIIYVAG